MCVLDLQQLSQSIQIIGHGSQTVFEEPHLLKEMVFIEGEGPAQQNIQHHSETPHVRGGVVSASLSFGFFALQHLGGEVLGRTTECLQAAYQYKLNRINTVTMLWQGAACIDMQINKKNTNKIM